LPSFNLFLNLGNPQDLFHVPSGSHVQGEHGQVGLLFKHLRGTGMNMVRPRLFHLPHAHSPFFKALEHEDLSCSVSAPRGLTHHVPCAHSHSGPESTRTYGCWGVSHHSCSVTHHASCSPTSGSASTRATVHGSGVYCGLNH
jgi:hypothetical protein